MKLKIPKAAHRRSLSGLLASALAATVSAAMVFLTPTAASAIALPVPLGTTASYSVLAGQGVTNTGDTVLAHDLGTHPNPAITGFPPGIVGGDIHAADMHAAQAKEDLTVAYNNAAGQAPDFELPAGIGDGPPLLPGVYRASSGVGITGDVVLDGQGSSDAVWVFQIPEALTTATNSRILLTNGASACNVFWQVGSSATLGVTSRFVGTLMTGISISANQGANIEGRLLAQVGAVTLNNNRVFLGGCATSTNGGTTGATTTAGTTGATTTAGTTGTPTAGTTGATTTAGTTGTPTAGTTGTTTIGSTTSGGAGTGGLAGGIVIGTGGTQGNSAGNTLGNTAGNTAGNNGNTKGNTAGNGADGRDHDDKPGRPNHGGKLDLGPYFQPVKPDHGKSDDGKRDHGKSDEHYGYDDIPMGPKGHDDDGYSKSHGDDGHSKSHEG
jgi:hypothetical protein